MFICAYFVGKKFQNVAKEGLKFGDEGEDHKEQLEQMEKDYEPLTKWLKDTALSGKVSHMCLLCVYVLQCYMYTTVHCILCIGM